RGHTGGVTSVAFSPDGRRLVSGGGLGDGSVRVWDVTTGQEVPRISPLEGRVPLINSVAFRPDGIWAPSASGFDNAAVRVWNATTGERLHLRLTSIHALAAGISPDGRTSPRHALSVAFSPDGRRIASGTSEGRVQVWDVKTGEPLGSLTGHTG